MEYECSKVKFATEVAAQIHIAKLKRTSNRDKIPKRAYLCEYCNTWHLTSSDKNEDSWREKYRNEIRRLGQIIKEKDIRLGKQSAKLKELDIKVKEQRQVIKTFSKPAVGGSVCDHKEKRRIFENCECVKCGALFIE